MTTAQPIIFGLDGNEALWTRVVKSSGGIPGRSEQRRFPDGEFYLRVLDEVSFRDTVILCSLDRPDEKFLPIVFLAQTLRELGAKSVRLLSPYLGYMRQDKRFHEGEAVTSGLFARLLSGQVDELITIDPHLHRYHALSDIYSIKNQVLSAAPLLAEWIEHHVQSPVLLGPDEESEQWVASVGAKINAPYAILTKTRLGDHSVQISVPGIEQWRNHTPVLVDDIISTARTMIVTLQQIKNHFSYQPVCVGVHAVFAGDAYSQLLEAGANPVVSCNSIAHPTNQIDIAPLLAAALKS